MTTLLDTTEYSGKSGVEWYLVFYNVEQAYWWTRLLKPGFQHVIAYRVIAGYWLLFQPRKDFLDVEFTTYPSYLTINEIVPEGAKVLRVTAWREQKRMRYPWIIGSVTCVEMIKALLGIRAFFLWTPWQLYRYCIKEFPDGQVFRTESAG